MDSTTVRDAQRDAQRVPSQDIAHAEQIEARLKNLHTCLPGIIVSYDATKQTAQVQPAIQRIFTERGPVNLPVCVDVPVLFPAGGNFVLTFPIQPNDECLLWFSERCIDLWFTYGSTQPPFEYRLHDLSDGFAFIGISSLPRSITSVQTTSTELRARNRSTRVTITNSGNIEVVNTVCSITLLANGNVEVVNAAGSITLLANGNVNIVAPTVAITGNLTVSGTIVATGNVTGAGKSLATHVHSGVTPGGGNTGQPV